MAARAFFLAALVLGAALPLLADAGEAHALPVRTTPSSGAVVTAPPREVVVVFSERIEPSLSTLAVRDANGTLHSGPSRLDDDGMTLRASLPAALPYGPYTVAWRALSAVDGHSTRGVVSFLFPDPSKPLELKDLATAPASEEALVGPQDLALRALVLLGVFALLGTSVLVLAILVPAAPLTPLGQERRLALLAAAGAALGALATLGLAVSQAAVAAQASPLAVLARPDLLVTGRFGQLAVVRILLLLAAAGVAGLALRHGAASREGRLPWAMALGLACGAVVTLSLSSHAAALPEPLLPMVNDVVHTVAAAASFGALAGLGAVLYRSGDTPSPAVAARFSALATVAVGLVVATGVAASLFQLRSPSALLGSAYGQVLLVKLGLVAVVLGFGAYNKFLTVPRLLRAVGPEAEVQARKFGRTVRLEAVIAAAVLVAAGALTAFSPPATDLPSTPPSVFEIATDSEGVNVSLLITPAPPSVGESTLDLFLRVGGASDGNATNATLTFTPPDRSLGENVVFLQKAHVGHFAGEGAFFTLPGEWKLRVLVQRTGAFDTVVDFTVPVQA